MALVLALSACGGGGGAAAPPAKVAAGGTAVEEPTTPDGRPVPTAIDCGDFATCARMSDGSVRCWGRGDEGELGDGGGPDAPSPKAVAGLADVVQVALGATTGCARQRSGKVSCWGTGRLGPGRPRAEHAKPTEIATMPDVIDLEASGSFSCALGSRGAATCWGMEDVGEAPTGLTQIAAGVSHACGLAGGVVRCWGGGDSDWADGGAFSKVALPGAKKIAAGDRHACVVTSDGGVSCFGTNDAGQLGTEPDMGTHSAPRPVAGVRDVVDVVAGETTTCAIHGDGAVTCWGANADGELGIGRATPTSGPSRVPGLSGVTSVCLAVHHGCALTRDHAVSCWGSNENGQIGDGTTAPRLTPTRVKL